MQPFANHHSKKNVPLYIRFFFPYCLCQPSFLDFVLAEELSRCSMLCILLRQFHDVCNVLG